MARIDPTEGFVASIDTCIQTKRGFGDIDWELRHLIDLSLLLLLPPASQRRQLLLETRHLELQDRRRATLSLQAWVPQPAFFYRPNVIVSERVVFILRFVGHRRFARYYVRLFFILHSGREDRLG